MNKTITMDEAFNYITADKKLMIGGFLGLGGPNTIIDEMLKRGLTDLDIVAADTAFSGVGIGRLFAEKRCKKLLVTHIGTNECTVKQAINKEIDIEFAAQGTFIRRIRCGGSGIGGFLTKVGMGSLMEEGKEIITVDGEQYLLEKPIRADITILGAHTVDKAGNVYLKGCEKNYNVAMAMASDIVIVEAENIVECGEIDKESIHIPFVYIDYIVQGAKNGQ
ncbi:MAG: 3-oxoacid CoA-transferase subunit A [Clostridia bacterium]|nr:3-oxoacid CoA-transferase subunit A [Clostridia bacterium]